MKQFYSSETTNSNKCKIGESVKSWGKKKLCNKEKCSLLQTITFGNHLKYVYMFEHNSNIQTDATYYVTCYFLNIIHAASSVLSVLLHSAHYITDYRHKIHIRIENNYRQMFACKKHKYK
jgi:hypothetical protein